MDAGGCHDSVMESSVAAEHSRGPTGADGLSVNKAQEKKIYTGMRPIKNQPQPSSAMG